MVPSPDTLVVVNCAGRTRSIMGAESLRRAGVPNKVVALRNGTMGWELAGLTCDHGKTARFPTGTPATLATALTRAQRFASDSGVRVISPSAFHGFEQDSTRSLYVLDVRDPEEFKAGHRAGSINAPGGQLVQATDTWIGVRGARIVLVDDTGARALMSAAWLRQMGHRDVFVVDGGLTAIGLGSPAAPVPELAQPVETISADGLADLLDKGSAAVIDLGRSIDFRAGHIPGAVWGVRSRLAALGNRLAGAPVVVITSPDGYLARLAVPEVRGLTGAEVRVLDGGSAAWTAAGRPLAKDRSDPPDDACIDFYLRPYDRNSGVEEAMNAYLTWEIDLANEIRRDATIAFGTGAGSAGH
jgi:rhodanese-related sulfurtransferase